MEMLRCKPPLLPYRKKERLRSPNLAACIKERSPVLKNPLLPVLMQFQSLSLPYDVMLECLHRPGVQRHKWKRRVLGKG
eukprot:1160831-Pelagomonas_calceolata.AAC.10